MTRLALFIQKYWRLVYQKIGQSGHTGAWSCACGAGKCRRNCADITVDFKINCSVDLVILPRRFSTKPSGTTLGHSQRKFSVPLFIHIYPTSILLRISPIKTSTQTVQPLSFLCIHEFLSSPFPDIHCLRSATRESFTALLRLAAPGNAPPVLEETSGDAECLGRIE